MFGSLLFQGESLGVIPHTAMLLTSKLYLSVTKQNSHPFSYLEKEDNKQISRRREEGWKKRAKLSMERKKHLRGIRNFSILIYNLGIIKLLSKVKLTYTTMCKSLAHCRHTRNITFLIMVAYK